MKVKTIVYNGLIKQYHGKKVSTARAFYWDNFATYCNNWKGTFCDLGSGGKTILSTLFPDEKIIMVESSDYIKYNKDKTITITANIEDMHNEIKKSSIDNVLCSAVLEHTKNPEKVILEIKRILKPGGNFCIIVPWMYPYHGNTDYFLDYWRFSHHGLKYLLEKNGFIINILIGDNENIENSFILMCVGKTNEKKV